MRVKIGNYPRYFGPYQLAELLCFWVKDTEDDLGLKDKPVWVHHFGEWLAHGSVEPDSKVGEIRSWDRERHDTLLSIFLNWIHSKQHRTIKVHIDRGDTWSMDDTLAHIILPMLKQLKENQQGAPSVDDKDVPEELRSTAAPQKEAEWDTDENHFKRWEWVMDEMIFAFESKIDDSWENQFESGVSDHQWKKLENGCSEMIDGPNHTKVYDWEGRKKYEARISNGFSLFGKYYQGLWN